MHPPANAILRRYPVMWQGTLALKNERSTVQMHFMSGNPNVARASLPGLLDGEVTPVRISQRMRLGEFQLEGVNRKIQLMEEHCILLALPCGQDQSDLSQQSSTLKNGFINYFTSKNAAGIVNVPFPGTQAVRSANQPPAFVMHVFPSCDFIEANMSTSQPLLYDLISGISYLVIIIVTV